MTKLDPNKLAVVLMLVALALIAAIYGYSLEIGTNGLRFERGASTAAVQTAGPANR